jgi:hypothetical protein
MSKIIKKLSHPTSLNKVVSELIDGIQAKQVTETLESLPLDDKLDSSAVKYSSGASESNETVDGIIAFLFSSLTVTASHTFTGTISNTRYVIGNTNITETIDTSLLVESANYRFVKDDNEYGEISMVDENGTEMYRLEVSGEQVIFTKIDGNIIIT